MNSAQGSSQGTGSVAESSQIFCLDGCDVPKQTQINLIWVCLGTSFPSYTCLCAGRPCLKARVTLGTEKESSFPQPKCLTFAHNLAPYQLQVRLYPQLPNYKFYWGEITSLRTGTGHILHEV